MYTPWGHSQHSTKIAVGIRFYSTASHGGIHLSPKRELELPEAIKKCASEFSPWFEEDLNWALVCLAFPQHFNQKQCKDAIEMITTWSEPAEKYPGYVPFNIDINKYLTTTPQGQLCSTKANNAT